MRGERSVLMATRGMAARQAASGDIALGGRQKTLYASWPRRAARVPRGWSVWSVWLGLWHALEGSYPLQPIHALSITPDSADGAPAFDRLFQEHEPQIFGYLYRMIGDRHLASDLCQETFLRAWQHFDK